MKFTRLEIDNFLSVGHADLALDGKGLVLLQGVNNDDTSASSNGAGKSTIPDALCWALFGVTARGETGDAIVNDKAKKSCRVAVKIVDGATRYSVIRHRKHPTEKNALKLLCDTGDLTRGTERETQEAIEKVLGCSLEVFKAAIYCGQEEMPDLPAMTDKTLKLLVEQAAGIERIEAAYEVARGRLRSAEQALALQTTAVDGARVRLERERENLAELQRDHANYENTRHFDIEQITKRLVERKVEFDALAAIVKGYKRSEIEGKLTTHRASLDSWNASQERLRTLRANLSGAQREQSKTEGEAKVLASKIKDLQGHLANRTGTSCPSCGREYDAERLERHLGAMRDQLVAKGAEFKDKMAELGVRKGTVATLGKALAELEAQPAPSEILTEIRDLESQLGRVAADTDRLRTMLKSQQEDENVLKVKRDTPNPLACAIERCEERIKVCENVYADAAANKLKYEDALAVAQDCVKVFGPAGVRAHILDTVTPFLNERTAEYLTVLSDGNLEAVWNTLSRMKSGEIKEKFNIDVRWRGGRSFGLISGGQRRKARIATVLALQDLVASRATKPIDLWIGDEIDDALDAPGLERLMTILETRARERGTVIVISHNELRDWIDQVATVTLDGGYSKVEGALCD